MNESTQQEEVSPKRRPPADPPLLTRARSKLSALGLLLILLAGAPSVALPTNPGLHLQETLLGELTDGQRFSEARVAYLPGESASAQHVLRPGPRYDGDSSTFASNRWFYGERSPWTRDTVPGSSPLVTLAGLGANERASPWQLSARGPPRQLSR